MHVQQFIDRALAESMLDPEDQRYEWLLSLFGSKEGIVRAMEYFDVEAVPLTMEFDHKIHIPGFRFKVTLEWRLTPKAAAYHDPDRPQ